MSTQPEQLLAIRLDDGTLITDPSWRCMADVMKSAHGQGATVMPGTLIAIDAHGVPLQPQETPP